MEENANTTFPVVVLTFEGSEDRMKALWEKNFQGVFKTVSVKPGYSILDVLAGILADNTIEKEFVLVQANTFPVAETTIDFLKLPFVYVNARGAHVFDNRLPAVLDKEMVAGYLEGVKSEADFIPEDFFKNAMIRGEIGIQFLISLKAEFTGNDKPAQLIQTDGAMKGLDMDVSIVLFCEPLKSNCIVHNCVMPVLTTVR